MTGSPKTRPAKSRAVLAAQLAAGLYAEVDGLFLAVVDESSGPYAWRPVRAAALRAIGDQNGGRTWMTVDEFRRWVDQQTLLAKKAKTGVKPMEAVGLSDYLKLKIFKQERQVSKVEALAMAHYAHGRPVPVEPGNAAAFDAWFTPRFGAYSAAAAFLEMRADTLGDRIRGYEIALGQRIPRAPDITLIRALEWIWSVGPFCPYGEQRPPAVWPGQEVAP